jgi:hypothetical protein
MSAPAPVPPPKSSWIERNLWRLVAAGVLLIIAVTPVEVSWVFAIGDVLLLWVLLASPLFKSMTRMSQGGEKLFYGGMAVVLGGFGAALLVGAACMGPLSRMNIH